MIKVLSVVVSNYLERASIHIAEDYVELRWVDNDNEYALRVGHEIYEALRVAEGQEPPVLLEVLVHNE